MKFEEMIKNIVHGGRARRAISKKGYCLGFDNGFISGFQEGVLLDGSPFFEDKDFLMDDWETVEERPQPVDDWPRVPFEEALKAMKEGAYAKREHWQLRDSYYMSVYGGSTLRLADTMTKVICVSSDDVLADDWQILSQSHYQE